jgi:hypothetical protein
MQDYMHPAQRYKVNLVSAYEYLGAIRNYDVLWMPEVARILMKCSHEVGDNWRIQMPSKLISIGYSAEPYTRPTDEDFETAVAMATCFAQAGREGLVRPETNTTPVQSTANQKD